MIQRLRLLVLMARPAVIVLLGMFAATGLAQGGHSQEPLLLGRALVVVAAFLVFSVVMNDLADEAIDRVNLPGDPRRPLVAGLCGRGPFLAVGVTAGVVALGGSLFLHGPAPAVVAGGLVLSLGYSLRPVRLADRGAVASLVAPGAYVAVPYLTGLFSARPSVRPDDLVLLGGLYVGFIGRILLKDFRDVRGDALFGKRTFLIRHGRRRTCRVSAACWVLGTGALAGVRDLTPLTAGAFALLAAAALALLKALSEEAGARRDENLISALAIVGRGTIVLLFAHLSLVDAGWPAAAYAAVMAAVLVIVLGQAWTMTGRGPVPRLSTASPEIRRLSGQHTTTVPSEVATTLLTDPVLPSDPRP